MNSGWFHVSLNLLKPAEWPDVPQGTHISWWWFQISLRGVYSIRWSYRTATSSTLYHPRYTANAVLRDRANNANNLIYVSAFYLFHKYNTGINYLSVIKQELLLYKLSKIEAHINIWCHSMKGKVIK